MTSRGAALLALQSMEPAQSSYPRTKTATTGHTTTCTYSCAQGAVFSVVRSGTMAPHETDRGVIMDRDDLYDEDADSRDEGPFAEDSSFDGDTDTDTGYEGPCVADVLSVLGDADTQSCWSDSDLDPALRYYHEDDVAFRRSNGLVFQEESGGGYWYRPSDGCIYNRDRRPTGVVFEDDEWDD